MQAISTKYAGATNFKGSRIIASADGGRITVSMKYDLGSYENHERAAHALMKKLGWSGRLVGGATKTGYCFVFADRPERSAERRHRAPKTRARRAAGRSTDKRKSKSGARRGRRA